MPRKSSDSVQVFYPKFDKRGLIEIIDEKLENLKEDCLLYLLCCLALMPGETIP